MSDRPHGVLPAADPLGFAVYLITDRRRTRGRPLPYVVGEAIAGGVKAVQLREKDLPIRSRLELARAVREETRAGRALLLMNGRVDLARLCEADGVHLPAEHLPVPLVRRLLPTGGLIGVSAHTLDEAIAAEDAMADFVVVGPVYHTAGKAQYGPPVGTALLEKAAEHVRTPIFALGGITEAKIRDVLSAGAWGVAAVSAILEADDIQAAARSMTDEVARWKS